MRKEFFVPKVERIRIAEDYGMFSIYPVETEYGEVIGNALRRVLLSSIKGAAVTGIRINGVPHEYMAMSGIREDVLHIMLNLKAVRMIITNAEEAVLWINKSDKGTVTSGDIICPDNVKIIDPTVYLFTIDRKLQDNIVMEISVRKSRGYLPTEQLTHIPQYIGEMRIDAIFSPIKKVNWHIEKAFVKDIPCEKLILEIWTDSSLRPENALSEAAQILTAHFIKLKNSLHKDMTSETESEDPEAAPEAKREKIPGELYYAPLETLGLSLRTMNPLKRAGIVTVGDAIELVRNEENSFENIKSFGPKAQSELSARLSELLN